MLKQIFAFMLFTGSLCVQAKTVMTFESPEQQTALIELYTSEGCSSCPPADNWLSGLQSDAGLWKTFIPVAFHVDYWDYIGWQDTLALPGNSQRQSRYKDENKIGFVYTPGFIVNGQEWQSWYKQRSLPRFTVQNTGVLKAEINDDRLDITFFGKRQNLDFNIVLLGFDIHSRINAGENTGRTLSHDFVALSHNTVTAETNHVTLSLADSEKKDVRRAIAIWVNTPESLAPIQAVGGWLP